MSKRCARKKWIRCSLIPAAWRSTCSTRIYGETFVRGRSAPTRAGAGARGGRLCPRHGQDGRLPRHERSGSDQPRHGHRHRQLRQRASRLLYGAGPHQPHRQRRLSGSGHRGHLPQYLQIRRDGQKDEKIWAASSKRRSISQKRANPGPSLVDIPKDIQTRARLRRISRGSQHPRLQALDGRAYRPTANARRRCSHRRKGRCFSSAAASSCPARARN